MVGIGLFVPGVPDDRANRSRPGVGCLPVQAVTVSHQYGGDCMEPLDMNIIANLISNQLFPIAICLLLMWYIKGNQDKERETLESLGKVVQENTMVMRELQTVVKEHLCDPPQK